MTQHLIITSHSIDGTFDSCARRFEFLHMYLKAPERESDAFAANAGTALHEATQAWQRALFLGQGYEHAEQIGYWTLAKWWPWQEEQNRLVADPTSGRAKGVGQRGLGNAVLLFEAIMESEIWANWDLVEVEGFGPAIEVPWRIVHKSLGEVPMPYGKRGIFATQGKIDFILRHKVTKKYRVIDLKTTAKALPAHNASFRFSGQAGQYAMVLAQALGLDWAKEGLDITYLLAFFGDYQNDLDVYPLEYHLDAEEVKDSIGVKMNRLEAMKRYAEQGHWPRTAHGCDFYGTPCGFLDICARRDSRFIEKWFEFEKESGRFADYKRVYEPVWELEA